MKRILIINFLAVFAIVLSCQKEESQPVVTNQNVSDPTVEDTTVTTIQDTTGNTGGGQTTTLSPCAYNKGYFDITIGTDYYELNPDSVTQYMIVYNLYQQNQTAFNVEVKDMNGDNLMMTFWIPNPFQLGANTYSEANGTLLDFDIWAGPGYLYSLSVPEAEITMQEANLVNEGGANIYRSAIGSFSGMGYTVSNDSFNISGNFCLNGWFQP